MTIGTQLRDLYVVALESDFKPLVPVTDKMLENEHVQMMVSEAHAHGGTFVLAAFTVVIDDEDKAWMVALHVYARALRGETVGGKPRPDAAQRRFLDRHREYTPLLASKKFSANPKLNEAKQVTITSIMQ
jgi:hypothetical protein